MIVITIDGRDIQIPSKWNELTREQLIYLSQLFCGKLTREQFQVHMLWKFMRLRYRDIERIDPEDVHGIGRAMDWVFKDVTLTSNLLPKIGRYRGPADGMKDCTFGEFTRAQMKVEDFSRTGSDEDLDELVAILYRPKKWFWRVRKYFTDSADCRQRFIEKFVAHRAEKMTMVCHREKYAVFLFVNGVMASLPEKFPNLYRKKSDGGSSNKNGWASVILSLADGRTDDESLDRIFYSNLYNVFMGLEQKAIQYYEDLKNQQHD